MKEIGITTTVPIEILISAGYKVIDLNNAFIGSQNYAHYIDIAEQDGFPKSSCAWIKGIYGVCLERGIKEVVGVLEGDCSNTRALLEVIRKKEIKIYPFSYPISHSINDVKRSIDEFMQVFDVDLSSVENVRKKLNETRAIVRDIDELTFKENRATGFENHLYQVSLSDFCGDIESFHKEVSFKVEEIKARSPVNRKLRLGYIGVPPMTGDIYDFVEGLNSRFVYNEVQREFAFPRIEAAENIYEQYHDYTYPYDLSFRIDEIKRQVIQRGIHGVIHYTQAFCFKAIENIVIKQELGVPLLNIEGDRMNCLDQRSKLRIEAFLDMLSDMEEVEN